MHLLIISLPVASAFFGALIAIAKPPGEKYISTLQHFCAGLVFAAAAVELLPHVIDFHLPWATLAGGLSGVAIMLACRSLETTMKGPVAMLAAVGVDLLIDGVVLGLSLIAGAKTGFVVAAVLTLEVLILGVTVAAELGESSRTKNRVLLTTTALALPFPAGAMLAVPIAVCPPAVVAAALSFGLVALLYLVAEELLVEAHEKPDSSFATAMFFVGFLGLVAIEQWIG